MPKWAPVQPLVYIGTMIFNVSGLITGPTGGTRRFDLDGEILETEYGEFRDIFGPVELLHTGRTVLVTAEVSGYTTSSCARCLDPALIELRTTIEQEYYPVNASLMDTDPFPTDPEEQVFQIDERNFVDLGEAVRQSLTSAVPMAPLCREDCKGLCPDCSARLDSDPCACEEPIVNPQWGALAEIASGLKGRSG